VFSDTSFRVRALGIWAAYWITTSLKSGCEAQHQFWKVRGFTEAPIPQIGRATLCDPNNMLKVPFSATSPHSLPKQPYIHWSLKDPLGGSWQQQPSILQLPFQADPAVTDQPKHDSAGTAYISCVSCKKPSMSITLTAYSFKNTLHMDASRLIPSSPGFSPSH
jgi:hypothetical protein